MSVRNFTQEEKDKLTQLIREGSTVMQEVEDLNGKRREALVVALASAGVTFAALFASQLLMNAGML